MKFPQSFIDEVRSAADIVTVIGDSVSLRKAGSKYKGLCPFHGEKTPSFSVDKEKGFFHCFGCGVGGDVFKFVELQEKVGFGEALRLLANRFGIPVPELEQGGGEQRVSPTTFALVCSTARHAEAVRHSRTPRSVVPRVLERAVEVPHLCRARR